MEKQEPKTIDDYIAQFPLKKNLQQVREAI